MTCSKKWTVYFFFFFMKFAVWRVNSLLHSVKVSNQGSGSSLVFFKCPIPQCLKNKGEYCNKVLLKYLTFNYYMNTCLYYEHEKISTKDSEQWHYMDLNFKTHFLRERQKLLVDGLFIYSHFYTSYLLNNKIMLKKRQFTILR